MSKIKYIKLGTLPDGSFGCIGEYTDFVCGEFIRAVPDDAELYFDDTFYRYNQVGGYWEFKSYTGQYLKSKYYADKTYAEMVEKALWRTSTAKAIAEMPQGTDFIIDGYYYQKCGAYILSHCTTSKTWYMCNAFDYNTSYKYMVGRSDWSSVEAKKLAAMQGELDKFGQSIGVDAVKTPEVLQEILRVSKLSKALDEVVEEIKAEREKVDLGKVAVEITDRLDVIKFLRDGGCVEEYKPKDYTKYKLYSDDASHKYLIPVHEYHYVVSLLKQAYNDENWDAYEDLLSGYKLLEGQEFTITLD